MNLSVFLRAAGLRRAALSLLSLPLLAACSATGMRTDPPLGDWDLASLGGAARTGASLAFLDGERAAGRGGCNRYSTTFKAGAAGELVFGPVAATKMACLDGDAMQLETAFFGMLAAARGYRRESDLRLQLLDDAGVVLAEFAPAQPDQP
jgi:heat shock protein HslJ